MKTGEQEDRVLVEDANDSDDEHWLSRGRVRVQSAPEMRVAGNHPRDIFHECRGNEVRQRSFR